jgi:hypothetical protein
LGGNVGRGDPKKPGSARPGKRAGNGSLAVFTLVVGTLLIHPGPCGAAHGASAIAIAIAIGVSIALVIVIALRERWYCRPF